MFFHFLNCLIFHLTSVIKSDTKFCDKQVTFLCDSESFQYSERICTWRSSPMNLTVSSKLFVRAQCFFTIKTVVLNILIKAACVISLSHSFCFFNYSSTFSSVYCDLSPEKIKTFSLRMFASLTKKNY